MGVLPVPLSAEQTVQYSGVGFVILAVAGLFAQLVIVQRFRPAARHMMRAGVTLMVLAFSLFVVGEQVATFFAALACLGIGLGLVRPGAAAAASLSVQPNEQGSVAGMIGGVAVVGNVFGPMLGTTLYGYLRTGPFLLNAGSMLGVLVLVFTSRRIRHVRA